MKNETTLRSNQLDHLIKINYFRDFGNIPTLTRILSVYDFFKQGAAKKVKKEKVSADLATIMQPYVTDKNDKGKELASYTIVDMSGLLLALERAIIALNLPDLDMRVQIQNSLDLLGYIGIQTGEDADRCRLIVTDVWPLRSKETGEPWAYRISTQSLGSGKTASLSVYAKLFHKTPISKGDLIRTSPSGVHKNKAGYWYLDSYVKE